MDEFMNIVNSIENEDFATARTTFNSVMAGAISERLDAKRAEIGATLLRKPKE